MILTSAKGKKCAAAGDCYHALYKETLNVHFILVIQEKRFRVSETLERYSHR